MAQQIFTIILNLSLLTALVLLVIGIVRAFMHKKSVNMFISSIVFIFTTIIAFFGGAATSPVARHDETLRHRMDDWDVEVFFVFLCLVALCWLIFYITRLRKK